MDSLPRRPVRIDRLLLPLNFRTRVDVLRLDLVHPLVSGNKWYKLRYHLEAAQRLGARRLVTFGGPWSNHLLATAAAAHESGFCSTGLVRGERPSVLSPTLAEAESLGMELVFLTRQEYRTGQLPPLLYHRHESETLYTIPEGGGGEPGAAGASTITAEVDLAPYSQIFAAVGTGTTVAGLLRATAPGQEVTGVVVLKGEGQLEEEIRALSGGRAPRLLSNYHFGGYAKRTPELMQFMNDWFAATGIPTDFVYTAKLFFALQDQLHSGALEQDATVLVIHSGGMQGNRSLPKGTLIF